MDVVSPEQLLLLNPYDGAKGTALDVIAQSEKVLPDVKAFAKTNVAAAMAEEERERLRSTIDERVQFLKQGFRYRSVQLNERRSDLRKQKRDNVPGAAKKYADVKKQQDALRDRKSEAIQTVQREPGLIQPMDAEIQAHVLVMPTDDPDDRQRRDDKVEARAMKEAIAFEQARGATVRDVSTAEKAHAADLGDWPGFDLLSERPDGSTRGIEVKGRARVGDVTLSENEWRAAITQREDYWLYVVYDCATSTPRLLRVQDPHGSVVATPIGDVAIDETEIFRHASDD
jgi:hypothetical protein